MKTRTVPLEQYSFMTKNLEDDNTKFLESSAPLIGYIVFYFNSLEEALTRFICEMISDRSDDEGLIITHKMSYSAKIDLLNRYSDWVQHTLQKEIPLHKKLILKLKECGYLRNMVIHAEWETSDIKGYTFTKIKFGSKGIQQVYVQFNIRSLKKIQKLILDTIELLDKYNEKFTHLIYSD